MIARLRSVSARSWVHLVVVLLCMVAVGFHQVGLQIIWKDGAVVVNWRLWDWYIEDAAISFAYARNLAAGDGLVTYVGGERVEGYSNPLWVGLMALWYLVGVDGFTSSKLMQLFFGAATVPLTYWIARHAVDDEQSDAPLAAPFALAVGAQFAIWNAAGLENSLFSFLLALGILRTLIEARDGGYPWASLAFLGLAVTRPEGIMYGAWGGFWAMVFALQAGRGLMPTVKWLLTFFVPFIGYQAARYEYFGWAFPNTYYAKLGERNFKPFLWGFGGWKYIRSWSHEVGTAYFLPLYILGAIGVERHRKWATTWIVVILGILLLYPGTETMISAGWPEDLYQPTYWIEARVLGMGLLAALAVIASIGGPGWRARVLAWGMACVALLFTLRSGGDWMKGYRWGAFFAVPCAILFAAGVHELARIAQRVFSRVHDRWTVPGWMTATGVSLLMVPPNLAHTAWFYGPRETGPYSVKQRVEYTAKLQRRLFLDHGVNLDVDMGAHLYWSEHDLLDIAGLVDVSMAHHGFEKPFVKEYLFEEKKPHFAHVHGGWASSSRIPTHPEWRQDYIEIPGYPVNKRTLHIGNHIRRDLVVQDRWTGTKGRTVPFAEGVTLAGFEVPSPEVSAGKSFYLEVGVRYDRVSEKEDFRILGFLAGEGGVHVFDLPMGYDWLAPSQWRTREVFHGRFAPQLPKELPQGTYDLGFVVLGADGTVYPADPPTDQEDVRPFPMPPEARVGGRDGVPARVAVGELVFPGAVVIGPPGTGEAEANQDFEQALAAAGDGRCDQGEASWTLARRHIPNAENWEKEHRAELAPVMAGCWAKRALETEEAELAALALTSGRRWDPRDDQVWAAGHAIAAPLYDAGLVARDAQDWETAYRDFSLAVTADPTLSWARRYAEEARDYRLGIDAESQAKAEAERQERLDRSRERRDAEEGEQEQEADPDRKPTSRPDPDRKPTTRPDPDRKPTTRPDPSRKPGQERTTPDRSTRPGARPPPNRAARPAERPAREEE